VAQAIPQVRRGAPERIRTSDTRFRKPLLYPLSYEGEKYTEGSKKPQRSVSARRDSRGAPRALVCQATWSRQPSAQGSLHPAGGAEPE
jgi:hypothetical protein